MKKSIGAQLAFSPLPTLVIGTYNTDMEPNVMTASFGGIVSAAPPALGISIRKATLTYENIVRSKVFTISIPSEKYIKEMDYFGLVTGKNNSKFLDTGLTATKGTFVDAPYVEEFPVNIECKLIKTIELDSHIQFIGEIVEVKISEEMVDEKGNSDIAKLKPISFVGNDYSYYGLGDKLGNAFSIGKDFKILKNIKKYIALCRIICYLENVAKLGLQLRVHKWSIKISSMLLIRSGISIEN